MNTVRLASIEAALIWSSAHARHTDHYYFPRLNLWRDFFPGDLGSVWHGLPWVRRCPLNSALES